jgi:hypothetical protein
VCCIYDHRWLSDKAMFIIRHLKTDKAWSASLCYEIRLLEVSMAGVYHKPEATKKQEKI